MKTGAPDAPVPPLARGSPARYGVAAKRGTPWQSARNNHLVQARGDGAHLVLREPGDAYLLGYPLHLAGARAGGVHLGDGGNEGAVHAPVALDHVVREEAAGAELWDAQRQRAGAGASDLSR